MKKQLQIADSLYIAGRGDSGIAVLKKLRPGINIADPLICDYYYLMAQHYTLQPEVMQLYADSGMIFFANTDKIKQYPEQFVKVMETSGDVCIMKKKYNASLHYYDKGRQILKANGKCDNGNFSLKIGGIFYNQKKFLPAARTLVEGYNQLIACDNNLTNEKRFFLRQSTLDNIGLAYEQGGMLDSAKYYYDKDLAYINKIDSMAIIDTFYLNAARVVVYDNLGGFHLKRGDNSMAYDYLNMATKMPIRDVDGMLIPPYNKLADFYIQTNKLTEAKTALDEARGRLNKFYKDNPESDIKWYRLYALYMFKTGRYNEAYIAQDNYIRLRDSLAAGSSKLYQLDVDRELDAIHQQQALSSLKQQDKIKQISLIGTFIIVGLFLVIIILISRTLNNSKKTQTMMKLQNQQMHTTVNELERANTNYIRIMRVMAHDLRNPISGITGLAAMLLDEDEFSDDSRHLLQLIESTGIHSMEMINELLKSGLADENEVMATQEIDVKELLRDSVELLQFKANEKQQQIIFDADDTPLVTHINHEKIWRVCNNLIVNAIKFSHTGGIIKTSIHLSGDERHIILSVADNGIGIADKDKDSIFEMFSPAKRVGTNGEQPFGLGLSISKKIIEKHHGKIWFESTPNVGTVFYIELPYSSLSS
ncbi:ATP-binding protein [Mucilaginibacter gynuensis]|uniref:ATP-binding protein n=1 Tax=Mucilaginibacter gynuensis TaxID=1302236 RepID=UPI0031EA6E0D